MHQNEWFQVWFFKNFLGRAHRAPSPDLSPRFFLGFALGSGFALNSRALCALDSGLALDTRALCALDSGFTLNFRLRTLVWLPPNKFLDPPLNRTRNKTLKTYIYEESKYQNKRETWRTRWKGHSTGGGRKQKESYLKAEEKKFQKN